MTVDQVAKTEPGNKGFGSSDIGPKRLITSEEYKVIMCFLYHDPKNNTYYDKEDTHTHPDLTREVTMLSSAMIVAVQMQTIDDAFLDRIRGSGKEDDGWMERKRELSRLKEKQELLPKNRELEDRLLYYKNGLFIPANEDILTEIAKGCHDSRVAGHFGQVKTIELVTRNFYWEKLSDWINDYVRSCDECQHNKSPDHARY